MKPKPYIIQDEALPILYQLERAITLDKKVDPEEEKIRLILIKNLVRQGAIIWLKKNNPTKYDYKEIATNIEEAYEAISYLAEKETPPEEYPTDSPLIIKPDIGRFRRVLVDSSQKMDIFPKKMDREQKIALKLQEMTDRTMLGMYGIFHTQQLRLLEKETPSLKESRKYNPSSDLSKIIMKEIASKALTNDGRISLDEFAFIETIMEDIYGLHIDRSKYTSPTIILKNRIEREYPNLVSGMRSINEKNKRLKDKMDRLEHLLIAYNILPLRGVPEDEIHLSVESCRAFIRETLQNINHQVTHEAAILIGLIEISRSSKTTKEFLMELKKSETDVFQRKAHADTYQRIENAIRIISIPPEYNGKGLQFLYTNVIKDRHYRVEQPELNILAVLDKK